MKRAAVLLTVFVALGVIPAPASASPEDLATSISNDVISPFCPGVTLENCPSDAAAALRARIVSWAEAGWSRSRIMDKLEAEYGASIRALPPTSGSGLWAWLAPGLVLLAGALLATVLARRWARRRAPEAQTAGPTGEMRARLDEELRLLRGEM
jgi:cytochrome c-type biogenesis protein CcmH/NrfF